MERAKLTTEAVELIIYIDNSPRLRGEVLLAYLRLARHWQRDQWDSNKAIKAMAPVVESGARGYCREYCAKSEKWFEVFVNSVRLEVAAEYVRTFTNAVANDQLDDIGERAAAVMRKPKVKRWTISEIKQANDAAGGRFFSRENMKLFHDTMSSFAVRHRGDEVLIERVRPIRDRDGNMRGGIGKVWRFDVPTGRIMPSREAVTVCAEEVAS